MKRRVRLFRRSHSIRSRLILLVLAIFLPALLVGAWVVSITHQLARDANQRLLEDSARGLSLVLELEMAQRAGVLSGLALSRMLDAAPNLSANTLLAFDDQARRTLRGLEGWLELRTASDILINTRLPQGSLPPPATPRTPVVLADTPQVRSLQVDGQPGSYHALFVRPVVRDGKPVLNLTLSMTAAEFQGVIDRQKIDAAWVAAIVDSEGHVVAQHPGGQAQAGRHAHEQLRARLASDRKGLMHARGVGGNEVTLYFQSSEQGWTYLTGMPRTQFEGVMPDQVRNLALGTLLLLTLAVLAALGVAHGIVRPIHFMKDLAQDLQTGQPVRAVPTGITECDEVAQTMEHASDAIRGSRAEMESRVEQAIAITRSAEQRMSHSQRLEALGRLTGGVAHDFNNLLGVISNSAHLLLRNTQDPRTRATVELSLRAVDAGSRLTQHLLRFAGRHAVRPCAIALDVFLTDAAELMGPLMGRRIELSVEVKPRTPAVFVDPNELELALINLALNARDAIAEHGHVVLQAARAEPDDWLGLPGHDYVVISVTDDGAGISDAIVKRVFEPFFSTKGVRQATGLGLSQVYGFCQQSGGTVRLNSTPGLGTSVNMILPTHNADQPATAIPCTQPLATITGTRVLLVEDHAELRDVTAALLASFGCDVVSSASAQDALRILHHTGNIDVLLTDVLMPGPMNGVALARQVLERWPGLPVLLISGHSGDVDDIDDFVCVHKPYTPEALVSALQQAMAVAREPKAAGECASE